jgi:pilus assembly protein CpaE
MLNKFFFRNTNTESADFPTETGIAPAFAPGDGTPEHLVSQFHDPRKSTAAQMFAGQCKDEQKLSPALAVVGAKGGAGATTLAINIATAIASRGVNTALLDAHLQMPTIAHALGKEPEHSLMELLTRSSSLDQQLYRVCSTELNSLLSLRFFSPPLDGSASLQSNLSAVAQCIAQIRNYSDCWIADLPSQLDRHLVTMLDACTRIVLVFEATVTSVAACRRWLEIFEELGYENDRIICVLNRSGSKFKAVEDQLDAMFADRHLARIPNASQLVWQSTTEGIPAVMLQPNHSFSRSISKLAQTILNSLAEEKN